MSFGMFCQFVLPAISFSGLTSPLVNQDKYRVHFSRTWRGKDRFYTITGIVTSLGGMESDLKESIHIHILRNQRLRYTLYNNHHHGNAPVPLKWWRNTNMWTETGTFNVDNAIRNDKKISNLHTWSNVEFNSCKTIFASWATKWLYRVPKATHPLEDWTKLGECL